MMRPHDLTTRHDGVWTRLEQLVNVFARDRISPRPSTPTRDAPEPS